MSASISNALAPPRISGASADRQGRSPRKPRSLLMPQLDEDEDDGAPSPLEASPGVYQSDAQMYVEIDRMVVTLFRRFELLPFG